jgi:DNA-binding MarR family transcriptional regulator
MDILIQMRKIIRSINLESKRIEKELGISIPQLLVLQILNDSPEYKATSKYIKEKINLNASTVSGIIYRLELKGLVARLPNLLDKRVQFITLTAKAADMLKNTPQTLQQKISGNLSKLSDNQQTELLKNIDLLVEVMDAKNIEASSLDKLKD